MRFTPLATENLSALSDHDMIQFMKELLILRHAKSSWANSYLSDHDRPLNARGKQDAPRMGKLLLTEDLVPDLIISSTAERALTTAEAVALASGYEEAITTTRRFYHADPEAYVAVLRELPDTLQRVMVVGHNPGMEMLVEELTGAAETMTTANIAYVKLPVDSWADLELDESAVLQAFWRPKELS